MVYYFYLPREMEETCEEPLRSENANTLQILQQCAGSPWGCRYSGGITTSFVILPSHNKIIAEDNGIKVYIYFGKY